MQTFLKFAGERAIRRLLNRHASDSTVSQPPGAVISLRLCPPDLFGISPVLPQLLRKAGVEFIALPESLWTFPANFPSGAFLWQGIDGSKILVSCQPIEGDVSTLDRLRRIEADSARLPHWVGELPLDAETQPVPVPLASRVEQRRVDNILMQAEFLSVVTRQISEDTHAAMMAAWRTVLETPAQGADTSGNISSVSERVTEVVDAARAALASRIDTRGLKRPVLVISTLSHFANEAVSIPIRADEFPVTAIGPDGGAVPVQVLEPSATDSEGGRFALFVPRNVPLLGYAVWDLGATLIPTEPEDAVEVSATHLENGSMRVEFDAASGLIVRIFDKDSERELLAETYEVQRSGRRNLNVDASANLLQIVEEERQQTGAVYTPFITLDSVTVVEAGPVRGAIRQVRKLPGGASRVEQTIRLTAGSNRIDFDTTIVWAEPEKGLVASFPVAINAMRASYHIPWGMVERQNSLNNGFMQRAYPGGFEPTLWADVTEGDYGIALLNDSYLDCDVTGSTIRVAVANGVGTINSNHLASETQSLRCSYSLLPHAGTIMEGEVVENGTAIYCKLDARAITGNRQGPLPLDSSFFEVDNAAVFIESVKPIECSTAAIAQSAIVVRLREAYNTRGEVLLTTTLPVKQAWLCDLLENELTEIPIENRELLLPVLPFELITVKFAL